MRILANKDMKHRVGQVGMASILVTMVLMIVISLIVLGFAQVSRRNQREALDNQLTNQAYYAAETGVNDYSKIVRSFLTANTANQDLMKISQTSCKPAPGSWISANMSFSNILSSSPDVQYTCVLVNASPTTLQYGSVGSTSLIIPINSSSPINNLKISWQTTQTNLLNPANNCPVASGVTQFPVASNWKCGLGIVRVDIVPTEGTLSLSSLQASTMTAFLVPTDPTSTGGGTVSYTGQGVNQYAQNTANQGAIVAGKCDNTNGCSVMVTNLNSASYYLRLSTIYQTASVQIAGYNLTNSATTLPLTGAQVLIDSTGKAQDILRRIQVRIPVNTTAGSSTFDAAIETAQSLCKHFQTYPGYAGDPNNYCVFP